MNTYANETKVAGEKKDRVFLMTAAACIISVVSVLMKTLYSGLDIVPYDPSTLFLLSLMASGMFLSCALTVLISQNRHTLYSATLIISALFTCSVHLLLSSSAAETLLALAFIPFSVVASHCIASSCEKAHTVTAGAVVLMMVFVFAIALDHYEYFGEISANSIGAVKSQMIAELDEIFQLYSYEGLGITSAQLYEVFELSMLLVPAFAIALVSIISYVEITLARLIIRSRDVYKDELNHWPLKMSRLSSVVFLVSFLIFVFAATDEKKLFIMTAANLFIALLPGFFFIGVRTLPSRFKRPGLFGIIFWVITFIYCIKNPAILLMIFAVMGAFDNLFTPFREHFYGEKTDKKPKK